MSDYFAMRRRLVESEGCVRSCSVRMMGDRLVWNSHLPKFHENVD